MAQTNAPLPTPIVVALDFERSSVYALRRAAEIFRRSRARELEVLHVHAADSERVGSDLAETMGVAGKVRRFLRDSLGDPSTIAGRQVGIHVRVGDVATEIVRFSIDVDAQLIVVGSNGREGLARRILGSTSETVLLRSPIPVILATGDPTKEPPALEPLCDACRVARTTSGGKAWWCARHSEHHARAHSYSFREAWPFELHDVEVNAGSP